mgnify:CR=1 FL=1
MGSYVFGRGVSGMNQETDYRAVLKRAGLKNTKRRTAIRELLERQSQPITAERIFSGLGERGVAASLSTVYRELDSLVSNDLAVKVKINDSNKALYEYNRMVHKHYLICLGCKKMIAIDVCPLKSFEERVAEQTRFTITDHKLNLYGYCPECRAKGLPKKE